MDDVTLKVLNLFISAAILIAVVVTCHDLSSVPSRVRGAATRWGYRAALTLVVGCIGFGEGVMLFGLVLDYVRTPSLIETLVNAPWGFLGILLLAFRPFSGAPENGDACGVSAPMELTEARRAFR